MMAKYECTLIQSLSFGSILCINVSKIPIALNEAMKSAQNEENFFEDISGKTPKTRLKKK